MSKILLAALLPLALETSGASTELSPTLDASPLASSSNVQAKVRVIDGSVVLSGELEDGVLEIAAGDVVTVELLDSDDHYAYAIILGADGSTPTAWERTIGGAGSQHTFGGEKGEIQSIVVAVEKSGASTIKYGPVITVKPKG